jgi:hypothetical protein
MEHTFHTRHDFTPELGWAAFQLLAELGEAGTTAAGLEQAAQTLASPLARRLELRKLLLSMEELALVDREGDRLALSDAGRSLAASAGRYEPGFSAGVHCLYAWGWLWKGQPNVATPSWSYRRVCREIRVAGPLGIEPDAVVLRIVVAGESFGAPRVSFSRSSVNGVTSWLKAQCPPLVSQTSGRLHAAHHARPGLTTFRYHVGALCALRGGTADVTGEDAELLADALLVHPQEMRRLLEEALSGSEEFHLLSGAKSVAYRRSQDPFLDWIVHGRTNNDQTAEKDGRNQRNRTTTASASGGVRHRKRKGSRR